MATWTEATRLVSPIVAVPPKAPSIDFRRDSFILTVVRTGGTGPQRPKAATSLSLGSALSILVGIRNPARVVTKRIKPISYWHQ